MVVVVRVARLVVVGVRAVWGGGARVVALVVVGGCQDLRHVRPTMVAPVHGLLADLVDKGINNGVLWTSRLEQAIVDVLERCPDKTTIPRALAAKQLTDHLKAVMSMLRYYRLEELRPEACGARARRYPKTGGFRKLATATAVALVRSIATRLEPSFRAGAETESIVDSDAGSASGTHAMLLTELPSDRDLNWLKYAGGDDASSDEEPDSGRATTAGCNGGAYAGAANAIYDEHGFPVLQGAKDDFAVDETLAVLDPKPLRRKLAALAVRANLETPQKKLVIKPMTTTRKCPRMPKSAARAQDASIADSGPALLSASLSGPTKDMLNHSPPYQCGRTVSTPRASTTCFVCASCVCVCVCVCVVPSLPPGEKPSSGASRHVLVH